jgi:hypothetical protein
LLRITARGGKINSQKTVLTNSGIIVFYFSLSILILLLPKGLIVILSTLKILYIQGEHNVISKI